MAQKTTITLTDDIDGSEGAETVSFGLDGHSYEVDLSEEHAIKLREAIGYYAEHARKITRQKATTRKPRPVNVASGVDNNAVREWARANGHQVSDRGRIKAELVMAFREAGN